MLEISQNIGDQPLAARIESGWGLREQAEKVGCLFDSLVPGTRRERHQHCFEFILAGPERGLIGLHVSAQAAQLRGFLSCHAPMVIKARRFVRHGSAFFILRQRARA
jgi:hypothetical protein